MFCQSLPRSLRNLRLTSRLTVLGMLAFGLLAASAPAAAPDLVAESITLNPKTAYLGVTTFTMSLTIRNAGTATAGAEITKIWASPDGQVNGAGNDVQIFSLPVPALAPGRSVTFTSVTATKLIIDPNRVGPNGTDYLPVGTYYVAVQVDVFNEVKNESNESNFFTSSQRLNIAVRQPVGPVSYLPATGTDNVSVMRRLQWTTVTNANRYDVYLARLKDTEQHFFAHSLLNITTPVQQIVLTDMRWPYGPYSDSGKDLALGVDSEPNNTPDILLAQNGTLSLYNRVYDGRVSVPRYHKPFVLYDGVYSTDTTSYISLASRKFGPGMISCLAAANMNAYYIADHDNIEWWNQGMDAVFATYMDKSYQGSVYVVMNKSDFRKRVTSTITITSTSDFMLIPLKNYRGKGVPGDKTNPMGIKSLVVADFDGDSDLDIMVGGDRYVNQNQDKIVVFQSDYRNSPNGDTDPPCDFPIFTPRRFGNMNSTLEDLQDMAVGDFDRDGLTDVVAASYHSDRLWILYNTTSNSGNIRSTRTLSFSIVGPLPIDNLGTSNSTVFRGANTVCVRDLNNDRLPDIVAGAYFDGKVVVYENQSYGPGGISIPELVPHVLATNLPNLEKVTTADVNGDGFYDILVSSAANDTIVWYENKGSFQFVPHTVTQNANRVGTIVPYDMNNDQMPDIVSYSQYDNSLTWFASWPTVTGTHLVSSNQINANYLPPQPMDFNTTYVWKVGAKAGQTYSTTSQLMTFRTQPTRINIQPQIIPVNPIEPGSPLSITLDTIVDGPQPVGDFAIHVYADPILDRGFLSANDPTVNPLAPNPMNYVGYYYFGRAYQPGQIGSLTPKFDATTMPEGLYNLYTVAIGDTPSIHDGIRDGVFDGVPDGFDTCLPWKIWQGFTNPTYGDDAYLATAPLGVIWQPGQPLNPTPRDKAVNVPTGTTFGWSAATATTGYDVYLNQAAATLPQYTSTTITNALPGVQSIGAGDLNGDGSPDLVGSQIAGSNDARIYWMDNRGSGRSFGRNWVTSGLHGAPIVRIADMDRDGKQDILAASGPDGQIWWYKNLGGTPLGLSSPNIVGSGVAAINSVQAADMDGDRDIDVLVASSVGNRLYYYERWSNGSYVPRVIDVGHGQALYARAVDLDQDGDMDVVATFWSPNSVAWYENKGGNPPTFVRHELSTTINNPQWLVTGDLDGDNDLDIAVASQAEGKIYRFINNGAATPGFTAGVVAQGLTQPRGLEIADFNHDSRPDLVTATVLGNKLLYLMNNGDKPPTFTQYPVWSYPTAVMDLAAADLDCDNFSEIAAATSGGVLNWFDYVVNYSFGNTLVKQNQKLLTTNSFKPATLSPAMGYQWQVMAKRIIPIYHGTLERVTTSTADLQTPGVYTPWTFFTGQSDLAVGTVSFTPKSLVQGQTVHFSITENNNGFSDSASHYTDIWASPDPIVTRSGNDILLARAYVGSIAAQSSTVRTVDVNTAAVGPSGTLTLPEGNYYIGVFVDALNSDKSESSKDNNKQVLMSPQLQILHRNNVGAWTDYQ